MGSAAAPTEGGERPLPPEEDVERLLLGLRPKLSRRLIRHVWTFLQIGAARRPDPPGVFIQPGVRTGKTAGGRDPPVQICFSFDTTGSMARFLDDVRREIEHLVTRLLQHIPGVQVSIVAHGDYGDENNYVVKAKDFSDDVATLQHFVREECTNTGGGDAPECYELVMHKMQELTWAATSAKALVMIGDAPPHGESKYATLKRPFIDWRKEVVWYAERGIHVYGVKCGNARDSFYDQIAKITGALVISIDSIDLMPELFMELCFREQQRWVLAMHPPAPWDVRAITDPRSALLNVCGSCLLAEPNFHEPAGVSKTRMRLLCKRLAREGHGEFVLQMALYARTQLYLRSVPNYLAALAARIPGCREHLNTYFGHLVRLPTDMLEVVKMSVSLDAEFAGEPLVRLPLPKSLRKICAKKFTDFSEYQLAKHKKRDRLCPDGKWISCTNVGKADKPDTSGDGAKGKGKGKGRGRGKGRGKGRPRAAEDPSDVEAEGGEATSQVSKEGPVLSMKFLIRACHISEPADLVMKVLGRRYPLDAEDFRESKLPGTFNEALAGTRMKLAEPLTFQTQLSKQGNTKESWETLIDQRGLPFMAMLRNLRNILTAGVSEPHHEILLKRLRNPKQVAQSMQMPHRFLNAYLAVDAAEKGQSFGKGGGKGKGKGKGKGRGGRRGGGGGSSGDEDHDGDAEEPVQCLPHALAEKYKEALDCAVQLSVSARLPALSGNTVVLCDVSGSMRYNDFAVSAKGVAGVTSAADLAVLMGILLFSMSEGPEHCCVALFSDGAQSPTELKLASRGSVFGQFVSAKEKVKDMGKTTELPMQWLEAKLGEIQADRVVILSDMLIGRSRNHPGGGGKLQELLARYRQSSEKACHLVCVDLFGSGATAGIDPTGDCGPGDVLISGFSDQVFKFIADPDVTAQLADVESILETIRAQEARRGPKAPDAEQQQQQEGDGEPEGEGEPEAEEENQAQPEAD